MLLLEQRKDCYKHSYEYVTMLHNLMEIIIIQLDQTTTRIKQIKWSSIIKLCRCIKNIAKNLKFY